ncbi:hypothetical protein [Kocuria oceani]|uniref:Helix-turn-helix domain-containing protein n=1 Tax=Kocuria oceani TaxID=988827 RepID=A0ABV9TII7_9MICC|nr:hypothetical protein [Kocuria oceani]
MSDIEDFRGYSPAEVAEMTGLYGEHELRRMAAAGKVAHHRGARNKVVFFPEDIKALLRDTRQVPAKKKAEPHLAAVTTEAEQVDPFRSTPRSRSAHRARQSA